MTIGPAPSAHFSLGIYSDQQIYIARVAESAGAPGLGSGARKGLRLRLPPLARDLPTARQLGRLLPRASGLLAALLGRVRRVRDLRRTLLRHPFLAKSLVLLLVLDAGSLIGHGVSFRDAAAPVLERGMPR